MDSLSPITVAMLTGLGAGLLLSIPVGPVNLTILSVASRRGFIPGMLVGLGASTMEVIYCSIAFTGFTRFVQDEHVKTLLEVFTFVFFLFLGMKFLLAKNLEAPTEFGTATQRLRVRVDERLKPQSEFSTGFARVLGNFGVLLFWIVLAGNFVSHDLVANTIASKAVCVIGVAIGTSAWFCGLSFMAARQIGQYSEPALLRMERFSGVCLLVWGFVQGIRIAWQLAKHKI